LPDQLGTMTLTQTITAARGLFAPGHLGALTRFAPFELVDDILERLGRRGRGAGVPGRVAVYFVLAVRNEVLRVRAGVKGPRRWAVAAA
jgi:hypothetical protein